MTTKNITGIITWLKGWFYDKDEITTKENALQWQINNKASASDLSTTNSNILALESVVNTKANQSDLTALANQVNSMNNAEIVKLVQSLPTASANTTNTLYIVTNGGNTTNNLYSIYITVKNGNNYTWEKIDDADLQGFMTSTDANNTFALKSHKHGQINNDGTIGSNTDSNKPLITTTNGVVTTGSFETTSTNIKMDGTRSVGSLNTFARADHVHPTDSTRAPTSHATTGTGYGLGTDTKYGHVKTINGLTQSSHLDGTSLSAYQGYVLKGMVDTLSASVDDCVVDIELVPKATDNTGAIKLIYYDES